MNDNLDDLLNDMQKECTGEDVMWQAAELTAKTIEGITPFLQELSIQKIKIKQMEASGKTEHLDFEKRMMDLNVAMIADLLKQ